MSDDNTTSPGEVERLGDMRPELIRQMEARALLYRAGSGVSYTEEDAAIDELAAKHLRAALTPPSSPASAEVGIDVSPEAARRSSRKMNEWIGRALDVPLASAGVGEIIERAYETWRAAPLNLGADPEHHQIIRAAFEGGFRARDRLIRRLVADADEEQARAERLSSPSPALRVAEEALEETTHGDLTRAFATAYWPVFRAIMGAGRLEPKGDDLRSYAVELEALVAGARRQADAWRFIANEMGYEPRAHRHAPLLPWLQDRIARFRRDTALATIRAEQGDAR